MTRVTLMIAACCTLLWKGAVLAAPGGLPACTAKLNACTNGLMHELGLLSSCNGDLNVCGDSLSSCDDSLSSCNAELAVAQTCGDGVIDPGEQCDQSNLDEVTCTSLGFAAGVLKCGAG